MSSGTPSGSVTTSSSQGGQPPARSHLTGIAHVESPLASDSPLTRLPSNPALYRPSPLSMASLKLQQEKEELRRLALLDPPPPLTLLTSGGETLSARESVASRSFEKLAESALSRKESLDNNDGLHMQHEEGEQDEEPISRTLEALDLEVVSSSYNV